MNPNSGCGDNSDRVQNFSSSHLNGAFFLRGDGSVHWVSDSVDYTIYHKMSTIESPDPK